MRYPCRTAMRSAARAAWAACLVLALAAPSPSPAQPGSLSGHLLVATDRIGDPRFSRTVIYMLQHDGSGAMGLVVNRPVGRWSYRRMLEEMGEDGAHAVDGGLEILHGGPVEPGRGFVLHSPEYRDDHTLAIGDHGAVTVSRAIVRAIAEGRGPRRSFLVFGYAGWGPGQLEGEIGRRAWISVDADERLVLGGDHHDKWERATAKRGIDL